MRQPFGSIRYIDEHFGEKFGDEAVWSKYYSIWVIFPHEADPSLFPMSHYNKVQEAEVMICLI